MKKKTNMEGSRQVNNMWQDILFVVLFSLRHLTCNQKFLNYATAFYKKCTTARNNLYIDTKIDPTTGTNTEI